MLCHLQKQFLQTSKYHQGDFGIKINWSFIYEVEWLYRTMIDISMQQFTLSFNITYLHSKFFQHARGRTRIYAQKFKGIVRSCILCSILHSIDMYG